MEIEKLENEMKMIKDNLRKIQINQFIRKVRNLKQKKQRLGFD